MIKINVNLYYFPNVINNSFINTFDLNLYIIYIYD